MTVLHLTYFNILEKLNRSIKKIIIIKEIKENKNKNYSI